MHMLLPLIAFLVSFLVTQLPAVAPTTTPRPLEAQLADAQAANPVTTPVRLVIPHDPSTTMTLTIVNEGTRPIAFTAYPWKVGESWSESVEADPTTAIQAWVMPAMWDDQERKWNGAGGGWCGTGTVRVTLAPGQQQPVTGIASPFRHAQVIRWELNYSLDGKTWD